MSAFASLVEELLDEYDLTISVPPAHTRAEMDKVMETARKILAGYPGVRLRGRPKNSSFGSAGPWSMYEVRVKGPLSVLTTLRVRTGRNIRAMTDGSMMVWDNLRGRWVGWP